MCEHMRVAVPGSSPLTRGKQRRGDKLADAGRLIPAHAGKTVRAARARSAWSGSSPLTRGKHAALLEGHVAVRLIPAHAGKTNGV